MAEGGENAVTRIVHVVPEINEANGVWRVASLLAQDQGGVVMQAAAPALSSAITLAEEVWVHGAWLPRLWRAAHFAMRSGCRLVRMTHGSLSPIYLCRQSPLKKRLVSPVERFFLRRADRVIATCQTEAEWIRTFEPHVRSIEVVDLKRFFNLPNSQTQPPSLSIPQLDSAALQAAPSRPSSAPNSPLRLLYLGRRHPLKGLQYLEESVRQLGTHKIKVELKIVSKAFGAEKEAVFEWCDVLVLPTLSENFGLVIAEALERGKRVITTDGAPAWNPDSCGDYGGRLIYISGFRSGSDSDRIKLLASAITSLVNGCSIVGAQNILKRNSLPST